MDTLERFNAALAYIETHLDGVIDGKEISKITFYSPYQFQKFLLPCLAFRCPNISVTGDWTKLLLICRIPMKRWELLH